MLFDGEEDLRAAALRRAPRAARGLARKAQARARTDISAVLDFGSIEELERLWAGARETGIEGLMLKRRDSPYLAGRPKGHWYKWKRAPLTLDAVLMYAQRGSGKRSSYYSDYTFGAWRDEEDGEPELVPVGKSYFGFTDEELRSSTRSCATTPSIVSARCARSSRSWCSRLPSIRCIARPGTNPASPCAFPASTASAGTSRRRRPTGWRRLPL